MGELSLEFSLYEPVFCGEFSFTGSPLESSLPHECAGQTIRSKSFGIVVTIKSPHEVKVAAEQPSSL